jgi:hypothetical protein
MRQIKEHFKLRKTESNPNPEKATRRRLRRTVQFEANDRAPIAPLTPFQLSLEGIYFPDHIGANTEAENITFWQNSFDGDQVLDASGENMDVEIIASSSDSSNSWEDDEIPHVNGANISIENTAFSSNSSEDGDIQKQQDFFQI